MSVDGVANVANDRTFIGEQPFTLPATPVRTVIDAENETTTIISIRSHIRASKIFVVYADTQATNAAIEVNQNTFDSSGIKAITIAAV